MSKYSKRVLCIEPNSNFNKYLKNMPKNCEILNCAVSSSEQETFLHAPIIDGDAKPNTAFISQNETVENTTCISRVNSIRLDNFIDENVGMIKIDVEGGELDVLNSSQKLIQRCWPNFLIEGLTKNELTSIFYYYYLFLKKIIYQLTFLRETYSIKHNIFLLFYILIIYASIIINLNNLYESEKLFFNTTLLISVFSILMHSSLNTADEPNRHQLFNLTPLYILSAISFSKTIIAAKKFFFRN